MTVAEAARAIWSSVSAATVVRSAMQLSRLGTIDKPFGSDVHRLDLLTARSAPTAASHPPSSASFSANIGIEPFHLPSLSIGNGGGGGVDGCGESGDRLTLYRRNLSDDSALDGNRSSHCRCLSAPFIRPDCSSSMASSGLPPTKLCTRVAQRPAE